MKLSETYALYRGNGKLAVLFLAALIGLFFINKERRGRINPLLFVVSLYTGIADAFVNLIEKAFSQKNNKKIYGFIVILFALFAVILSGGRIWSYDFIGSKEVIMAKESDYENAAAYLMSLEESPKVLADFDMMSGLLSYSSSLKPMYNLKSRSRENELGTEERKLYEAICDRHPSMEMITRMARKEGHYYVVVDKTRTWPDRPIEGMYELINTVGTIDIYEYGGYAYE